MEQSVKAWFAMETDSTQPKHQCSTTNQNTRTRRSPLSTWKLNKHIATRAALEIRHACGFDNIHRAEPKSVRREFVYVGGVKSEQESMISDVITNT